MNKDKYLPSFLGYKILPEIKYLQKNWKQIDANKLKIFLALSAKYLKDNDSLNQDDFNAQTKGIDQQIARKLFAGTLTILRSALRSKYNPQTISEQLQQEIQMPTELANLFGAVIKSTGKDIVEKELENKLSYPQLEYLDWRIDVTISTGSMNRVLKPSIMMQLNLDDGRQILLQLNQEKFQELRYQVASVLKEMQNVEANPILKLEH